MVDLQQIIDVTAAGYSLFGLFTVAKTTRYSLVRTNSGDKDLQIMTTRRCQNGRKLWAKKEVAYSAEWFEGADLLCEDDQTTIERTQDINGVDYLETTTKTIPKHTRIVKIYNGRKLVAISTDDGLKTFVKMCNKGGYSFTFNGILIGLSAVGHLLN